MNKLFSLVSSSRADETGEDINGSGHSTPSDFSNFNIDTLASDLEEVTRFPVLPVDQLRKAYGNGVFKCIKKGYTISRLLGKGAFGTTFSACKSKFKCIAIKIVELQRGGKAELLKEFNTQHAFHLAGLAPAVIGKPSFFSHNGKTYGVITMTKIDGVLDSILKRNLTDQSLDSILFGLLNIVSKLDEAGLAHRDMHFGNVSFNYETSSSNRLSIVPSLIDFGFAQTRRGSSPALEIIQLLRTLSMSDGDAKVTTRNQNYILPRLLAFYQNSFDPRVKTQADFNRVFHELFDDTM